MPQINHPVPPSLSITEIIQQNESLFNVPEVEKVGFYSRDRDAIVVICVPSYSTRVLKYLQSLIPKLGINISVCSGANIDRVVFRKRYDDGHSYEIELPKLEDKIEDLKKEYPNHFYGEITEDIHCYGVSHTDKVWDDGVATYKYFDRDPKATLDFRKGDKIFIGRQDYNVHINLYVCRNYADWFFVNEERNPQLFNILFRYLPTYELDNQESEE